MYHSDAKSRRGNAESCVRSPGERSDTRDGCPACRFAHAGYTRLAIASEDGRWSSIEMPTLTVDTSGIILAWSREAEALLGWSASEALGRSIELIMPEHLRARHHAGFGRFVQTGVSTLPEVTTSPMIHKNGETKRLLVSVK